MSDEQSEIENKKFPLRVWFITAFIFGLFLLVFCYWLKCINSGDFSAFSLGDIGAFLAALASTLAWYWFLESYILQNKELKASVKAQQGTEDALKQQSTALKAQLKITQEQFEIYKKEQDGKKPHLKLNSLVQKTKGDFSSEVQYGIRRNPFPAFISTHQSLSIRFELINIKGDCKVKDFKIKHEKKDNIVYDFFIRNDKYYVTLYFYPTSAVEILSRKLVDNIYNNLEFTIHYSYSDSSSSDTYELKREGTNHTLTLLSR